MRNEPGILRKTRTVKAREHEAIPESLAAAQIDPPAQAEGTQTAANVLSLVFSSAINMADSSIPNGSYGVGWKYDNSVYTILNGANLTITGSALVTAQGGYGGAGIGGGYGDDGDGGTV